MKTRVKGQLRAMEIGITECDMSGIKEMRRATRVHRPAEGNADRENCMHPQQVYPSGTTTKARRKKESVRGYKHRPGR